MLAIVLAGTVFLFGHNAVADNRLQVGLVLEPTRINDEAYEFFSSDNVAFGSYGIDIRVLALDTKSGIQLLPMVGYRHGFDEGYPSLWNDTMQTSIRMQDLFGGLRVRGWITPWFGLFGQVNGGVSFLNMEGELDSIDQPGMRALYVDKKAKWTIRGMVGADFRISPTYLKSKCIDKFNFGGEIGFGFVKRGQTNFYPTLEGGDDNSIAVGQTHNFGDINLTGWFIHLGLNFYFF